MLSSVPTILFAFAIWSAIVPSLMAMPSINVNRSFWKSSAPSSASDSVRESAPESASSPPLTSRIFDDEELEAYRRDGYLLVRAGRLLPEDLVELMSERQRELAKSDRTDRPFSKYFTTLERGMIFENSGGNNDHDHDRNALNAFRAAAIHSRLPQAAAELMGMVEYENGNGNDGGVTVKAKDDALTLRVLRDVLLAKDVDESGCNWHVDDQGFWPESFLNFAPCGESINVWIALDDMPARYRGSMALAVGSHRASWREEAYEAIGQNRTEDGGRPLEELVKHIQERKRAGKLGFSTCSMHLERPDMLDRLEASCRIFDLKRGDIIFATRSLFHKTDDVTEEGKRYYKQQGLQTLARYSIRYSPGVARIPVGWVSEWSFVMDKSIAGKSLDYIQSKTGKPWYPTAWPRPDADIDEQLDRLALRDLSEAKILMKEEAARFFALTK